MLVVFQF